MGERRLIIAAVALVALVLSPGAGAHPVPGAPNCPIFPANSPWNQRVDALPVAAGSAAILKSAGIGRLHADFSDSDADGYGIPINVVDSSTPAANVTFDYEDESDPGPYRIPANPLQEGGSDRHILLVDRATCRLSELFAAERSGSGWHAGSGATWDLNSLALRPKGWTSADAAGLPILPGLARHSDITAGGIDHALRMTLARTQRAYLFPARHYASDVRDPRVAPMGLRIRIRASFDTTRFGPQTRAILEAGKRYGFIVADNGSDGFITGAPAPGWDDDDLHDLHDLPGSALEVVDTTKLTGTPKKAELWNTRWLAPTKRISRVQAFHSRSGKLEARAIKSGKVVARKRIFAKQGAIQIDLPKIAGARYSLRVL